MKLCGTAFGEEMLKNDTNLGHEYVLKWKDLDTAGGVIIWRRNEIIHFTSQMCTDEIFTCRSSCRKILFVVENARASIVGNKLDAIQITGISLKRIHTNMHEMHQEKVFVQKIHYEHLQRYIEKSWRNLQ